MSYLKSVTGNILALIMCLLGGLFFLLTTTAGLDVLIKVATGILPGQLNVQQVEGALIKGVSFRELTYSDSKSDIHILEGNLVWTMTMNPWHLNVLINHVHVQKLHLSSPETKPVKDEGPSSLAIPIPTPLFNIQIRQLMIDELSIAQIKAHQVQLVAAINNSRWSITRLEAQYENQKIDVQAQGQLQKTYDLSANVHLNPVSSHIKALTGQITLSGNKRCYKWDGQFTGWLPVTVNGTLLNVKQFDSTLSMGMNRLTVSGDLPDKLHLDLRIPQPQDLHPSLANIKTTISATGDISASQHGQFTVVINPGLFQSSKNSTIPPIPFQGGSLSLNLTPEALQANVDFTLNPNEIITGSLRLPKFDWRQPTSLTQSLDGTLSLRVNSLEFLKELSPVIVNPHGQLSADLILKGSLGTPDVQGTLKLLDAGLSLPEAGVTLNPVQATLSSHNKHWDVAGSIGGGNGRAIDIKGSGEFLPRITGLIQINADNFPVLKTPEYSINISPQLALKIDRDLLDITGVINVPAARFKPMVFSNTINLTNDAVFVSSESVKTPALIHVKADVLVKVGQDVVIDAQGLHGVLGGEIQITLPRDGELGALGQLTIRDGSYKAYGQDLAINHGQLIFAGATPENPQISLRAVRTFDNTSQFSGSNQLFDFNAANLQTIDFGNHVTVGINVSGYLNAPKVKLFSVPSSLSQADILSMLILGKPANQASQSGGQLLLTAISAMNLDSGAKGVQLLSQLKQKLGFDFDVKSSSTNNPASSNTMGDTAFVVGKSLSKRLYLSYSVGILQENSNVLILKYLLNKYFSVQVTASSTENGVDLLYSAQP